jgi:lipoate-protein ligase A
MFLLDNNGVTDPRTNLALEEYCLRHLDPVNEYLLFYINNFVGKRYGSLFKDLL